MLVESRTSAYTTSEMYGSSSSFINWVAIQLTFKIAQKRILEKDISIKYCLNIYIAISKKSPKGPQNRNKMSINASLGIFHEKGQGLHSVPDLQVVWVHCDCLGDALPHLLKHRRRRRAHKELLQSRQISLKFVQE